jgi:hypothetical protein
MIEVMPTLRFIGRTIYLIGIVIFICVMFVIGFYIGLIRRWSA